MVIGVKDEQLFIMVVVLLFGVRLNTNNVVCYGGCRVCFCFMSSLSLFLLLTTVDKIQKIIFCPTQRKKNILPNIIVITHEHCQ